MIENLLRQYDNFGRPEQLFEIVRLTGQAGGVPPSDFMRFQIPKSAIDLLVSISILDITDNCLRLRSHLAENKTPQTIIEKVFESLKKVNLLHNFLNDGNVFYDRSFSRISIRNDKIPLQFSALRNLFVDMGFFVRGEVVKFEFYIPPEHQNWFLSKVIPDIEASQLSNNPSQGLFDQRIRKEKLGREAEEFVLNFERRVRIKHPKTENIQIISDIDTRAGYDIRSYSSDSALLLDKFIEVKSYYKSPYFYWSNNEVRVAKEKGAKYFLYLVDRNRMHENAYRPLQIANPVETVFGDSVWDVRNDGYFVRKDD